MKKAYLLIFSLLFLSFSLVSGASATLIDDGDGLTATFFYKGAPKYSTSLAVGDSWTTSLGNTVSVSDNQLTFSFANILTVPTTWGITGIQVGDIDGSFDGYNVDTNIAGINYSFENGIFALNISGAGINTNSYLTATMHNPIPAPILLLGTGLIGMAGFRRKIKK